MHYDQTTMVDILGTMQSYSTFGRLCACAPIDNRSSLAQAMTWRKRDVISMVSRCANICVSPGFIVKIFHLKPIRLKYPDISTNKITPIFPTYGPHFDKKQFESPDLLHA